MSRPARLQAARQKARDRRIALDVDREARDRRIEDAAAQVFAQLEQRAEAEAAILAANAAIGAAPIRLTAEGLNVEAVAHLLELDVAEVGRLSRAAGNGAAGAAGGQSADAARRAG